MSRSPDSHQRDKKPRFALVPQDIIESGLDASCVRLYAFIDLRGGPKGTWEMPGAMDIGDLIGMQAETLLRHARHLAEAGLIEYGRKGQGKYVFRILHNPAREKISPAALIPPSQPRARKPSKYVAPVPRTSGVAKPQSSGVRTRENQRSDRDPCPPKNGGQPKYEVKNEGVFAGSQRAVHPEVPPVFAELFSVDNLTDEDIGLFPCDREELDEWLAEIVELPPPDPYRGVEVPPSLREKIARGELRGVRLGS
jgi:hypothetical protein